MFFPVERVPKMSFMLPCRVYLPTFLLRVIVVRLVLVVHQHRWSESPRFILVGWADVGPSCRFTWAEHPVKRKSLERHTDLCCSRTFETRWGKYRCSRQESWTQILLLKKLQAVRTDDQVSSGELFKSLCISLRFSSISLSPYLCISFPLSPSLCTSADVYMVTESLSQSETSWRKRVCVCVLSSVSAKNWIRPCPWARLAHGHRDD